MRVPAAPPGVQPPASPLSSDVHPPRGWNSGRTERQKLPPTLARLTERRSTGLVSTLSGQRSDRGSPGYASCFIGVVCRTRAADCDAQRMDMTLDKHQEKACLLPINEPEGSGRADINRRSSMIRSVGARRGRSVNRALRTAAIAWLITAVYYFYQYTLRSAPAVMMPQLSEAFGLSAMGVASMVGLFYYGYSPFSLVAGVAMDRLGPRRVIPIGAATGRHRRAAVRLGQQRGRQHRTIRCRAQAASSRWSAPPISPPPTSRPRARPRSSARRRCSAWPAAPPASSSSGR